MGSLSNNIKSGLLCGQTSPSSSAGKRPSFSRIVRHFISKLPQPGGPFEIFKGEVRAAWIFTAPGRHGRGLYGGTASDGVLSSWYIFNSLVPCAAVLPPHPGPIFPSTGSEFFGEKYTHHTHTHIHALLSIGLRQNKRAASDRPCCFFFTLCTCRTLCYLSSF